MMTDVVLTRQDVTARIAEFYDPAGLMEPIKLQLKLLLARLNGKDILEDYYCGFCGFSHYSNTEVCGAPGLRRQGHPTCLLCGRGS